jgi:hypothetical protein
MIVRLHRPHDMHHGYCLDCSSPDPDTSCVPTESELPIAFLDPKQKSEPEKPMPLLWVCRACGAKGGNYSHRGDCARCGSESNDH